ncbi:hypothetical protein LPJ59_007038 [Coemansia sp. RSA 2399]|nr:hypothetical protein LPJ59_007038 [Coemansia sp. RSA 2399]KAJ1884736.1 hypothetical protein LPJ81_007032 [Coemansia sp. IMI 209127]
MSALQTELLGKSLFSRSDEAGGGDFPEHDVTAGRASTKEEKHIAELAQEFRENVKSSVFYLHLPPPPRDVERYSDRYFKNQGSGYVQHPLKGLQTNVDLFPEELHTVLLKKRVKRTRVQADGEDDLLEVLKKTKDDDGDDDAEDGDKDKEKKDGESDDDDGVEGEIEEEEEEEENDYMDSYFDNGEEDDMGDADDDDGGGGGGGAYY